MSGWTDTAKIAREIASSRHGYRMELARAYIKLNRTIMIDTRDMDVKAFRDFAERIDLAQHLIHTEITLSGGHFDTLYHLAIQEHRERLSGWLDKTIAEQADQRAIVERIIAPVSYDAICEFSEQDEQER